MAEINNKTDKFTTEMFISNLEVFRRTIAYAQKLGINYEINGQAIIITSNVFICQTKNKKSLKNENKKKGGLKL